MARFELANLGPTHTGLPFTVWISPRMSAKHDVRVRVSKGVLVHPSDLITVAVRPRVRVIEGGTLSQKEWTLLTRWVDLNRDVLIRYWDGDIEDAPDAIAALKRVDAEGPCGRP